MPAPEVRPVALRVKLTEEHAVDTEADAVPAAGVPEQAVDEIHPKRILGLVFVLVPDDVVLLQTFALLSALYHLDQVPVPNPDVVH